MALSEHATPSPVSGRHPASSRLEEARNRLIVALDVSSAEAANDLVSRLEDTCHWFKVGLELFAAAGPAIVRSLISRGHSIFLDLKFHDIPNTVAGAVRSGSRLGVRMMTVHAAGGPEMLKAAHDALQQIEDPPELLAVTVLTSMDQRQLDAVGLDCSAEHQVARLARLGLSCGIRGFVCSPQEVGAVRALAGPDARLVVPGVRPTGTDQGDQARIATPGETIRRGASFLVVGRPITQATDPARVCTGILEEMAGVLGG
jgi:orotidine-5'-phosphate decarboxylase